MSDVAGASYRTAANHPRADRSHQATARSSRGHMYGAGYSSRCTSPPRFQSGQGEVAGPTRRSGGSGGDRSAAVALTVRLRSAPSYCLRCRAAKARPGRVFDRQPDVAPRRGMAPSLVAIASGQVGRRASRHGIPLSTMWTPVLRENHPKPRDQRRWEAAPKRRLRPGPTSTKEANRVRCHATLRGRHHVPDLTLEPESGVGRMSQ
jgi:hypothetical protein